MKPTTSTGPVSTTTASPGATPSGTSDEPSAPLAWGGRAAIAAPVLTIFAIAVGAPLYTEDMSTAAQTTRLLVANGATLGVLVLLTLALVGLYVGSHHRLRAVGHGAFAVALTGTVLAAGGAWDALFAMPYVADRAPAMLDQPTGGTLLAGFLLSYVVLMIGWAAFAGSCLHAQVLSRASGITVMVGALFAIVPSPTATRLLVLAVGAALAGRHMLRS